MSLSTFPILAFGFASPLLLGGLALAGIPILIHLLHKRRYVEVDWAAMQFLLAATRKRARRTRIENLILLMLRTLVLTLLVLAMARPHFESSDGVLTDGQPTHRVIVVDSSFSMRYVENSVDFAADLDGRRTDGTRFDRARDTIRRLVESGRRGDAWNVVRIAGSEPFGIINQPAFDSQAVLDEMENLSPTDSAGDLIRAFETVAQMLKLAPELPRKEVIFVSDLQAAMWAPEAAASQRRMQTLAREIGGAARVSIVNVAEGGLQNGAVTALSLEEGVATVDQPISFRSAVRNFGASTLRDQVIELLVDGRLADTRRIDVPPGIDVPVDWQHSFRTDGEHLVEVHLQDDGLSVDNRRWLTVSVRDHMNVLLIDGAPAGRDRDSASFYVSRALEPSTLGDAAFGSVRPQTVAEGELPSINLSLYDAVVLCNVGLLTEREAGLLESFVRSGGGLVILPGDRVSSDSYNQRLYREGNGILPARMGDVVEVGSRDAVLTFDPRDFSHPLVRAFRGNPGAGLEATMTMKYLRLEPDSEADVALWFSDGTPALLDRAVAGGRVILAATSADERWGTWAIWAPSFVPMINEMVLHSVSGRERNRQLEVGEPLITAWPSRVFDMPVAVRPPEGPEATLRLLDQNSLLTVSYEDTTRAGIYRLVLGSPLNRTVLYAVNVEPSESDLTPADREQLQSRLFSDVEVFLRGADAPGPQNSVPEYQSGISLLARCLAWTVLVFLLVEPLLAWKFEHGIMTLGLSAILALMVPLLGPVTAIIVGGAAIGCAVSIWKKRIRRSA